MKENIKYLSLIAIILLVSHTRSLSSEPSVFSENNTEADIEDMHAVLMHMNIPLLEINTVDGEEPTCDVVSPPEGAGGSGITNATKVPASMKIIKNGETLYDSGEFVNKESGLTLKIRGNTSAKKQKKPYKLKLQKKADLLFRDDKKYKDKDWVLLRTGASLITPIGFWTSELFEQEWTPAHEIVNVWMNGTYRGLYILCEQVTVNSDSRINIDKNEGYVVECDAYWWTEDIYFPSTLIEPGMKFTYKYPDPDDITEEWHQAVSSDVIAREASILNGTYDEYYDCESFAKWLIAWDLLGGADMAGANMYMVKKDAYSKITMGPLWDFDQALKLGNNWIAGHHNDIFYFHRMLESDNDSFRKAFYNVWREKGQTVTDGLIERINAFADSPAAADYQRSLDLQEECGISVDSWQPYVGDLEFMRDYSTEYLAKRAEWINAQINEVTGVCDVTVDDQKQEDTFDILGRKISNDTPGMQIRAGKKIFVRP